MGFSANLALENGIEVQKAYFRISYIQGDNQKLFFNVSAYLSKDHFLEGKSTLSNNGYEFKPDVSDNAPNFYKQAYVYLKTLDYYKNAKDVLEEGQSPIWDSIKSE